MNNLAYATANILESSGALVEPANDNELEVVVTETCSKILGVPTSCRLNFDANSTDSQAIKIRLESDWTEKLKQLIINRGHRLNLEYRRECNPPGEAEILRLVAKNFTPLNGIYRIDKCYSAKTYYHFFIFQISATSDDKREDQIILAINDFNSFPHQPLVHHLLRNLDTNGEFVLSTNEITQELLTGQVHLKLVANQFVAQKSRLQFKDFILSMKRRLTRDSDRLHEYYSNIIAEHALRHEKKILKDGNEKACEELQLRYQSVKNEYSAKIADLQQKYSLTIDTCVEQVAHVLIPVSRIELNLMRRKNKRKIVVDWNPLSHKIDSFYCEKCFSEVNECELSDEAVKIHCPGCA